MIHWPEPQPRREPHEDDAVSAFLDAMSDDDLDQLIALRELAKDDTLPPWAYSIIDEIVERTVELLTAKADEAEAELLAVQNETDLPSLLAAQWLKADAPMRDTLRTLAARLGVDLPMIRLRPPQRRDRNLASSESDENEIATLRKADEFSGDPSERNEIPDELKRRDDAIFISGDEDAWEPCDSLYEAVHPENIGWS